MTVEALNRKPDPKTWSIAQNLHHLIITNESYFPIIQQVKAGAYRAPWFARFSSIPNLLGKWILKAVNPQRTKKLKTFRIWEPSTSDIPGDIVSNFLLHQEVLKRVILDCSNLPPETIISSPANKNICYPISTAFDIIVSHEWRHFHQARELKVH